MKIGVLSDSHDHLPYIQKACKLFIQHHVEKIIHCGDLVAPFINRALKVLEDLDIGMIGVFGNNDGERDNMNRLLGKTMKVKGDFFEMELEGKKIAVYHGTILSFTESLIKSQKYDLVLTGHTHQIKISKVGKTLAVNPGETCGYLTGKATCAIINLEKKNLTQDDVEIIDITEDKFLFSY